jgi:hypothetical protein
MTRRKDDVPSLDEIMHDMNRERRRRPAPSLFEPGDTADADEATDTPADSQPIEGGADKDMEPLS